MRRATGRPLGIHDGLFSLYSAARHVVRMPVRRAGDTVIGLGPALTPDLAALLPEKARTFAFAARFLPRDQRSQVVVLYAFCRLMDDLVDEPPPGVGPAETRRRLTAWRDWLCDGATTRRAKLCEAVSALICLRFSGHRPMAGALAPRPESLAELTAWLG